MRYQHALCLYPYVVDQAPGIGIFPPTGLEYVATALKGHVGRVSLIDCRHERRLQSPAKMAEFIRPGVDLICVSVYWQSWYRRACEFISQLPSDRTIVVGGRQATEKVEDVFERCPNVDAVVRGEGEQTVQELADGRPWDQILGLSWRCKGKIVHNANRPLQPIEDIALPDRSLRRNRYVPTLRGVPLLSTEFDTILSSRGCPYKCKFCTFSLNPLGQKRDYVARSAESVVDEIASTSAKCVLFADDNFFYEPKRVERICELLIERGIDKRYAANARLEVANHPQMLKKAHRAGFRIMLLGIESASDKILKQLGKGFTTQKVREAFAVLRKLPFFYHAYFMYGNVGETEQEMLAIPGFARELGVHMISLSQLRIDQFTPLRQVVESTPGYWITPNGHVYSEQYDKKRLLKIRNRIRNRFMYHPGQLAKALSMLNDCDVVTYGQMAQLGLMAPLFLTDYVARRGRKLTGRLWAKVSG